MDSLAIAPAKSAVLIQIGIEMIKIQLKNKSFHVETKGIREGAMEYNFSKEDKVSTWKPWRQYQALTTFLIYDIIFQNNYSFQTERTI